MTRDLLTDPLLTSPPLVRTGARALLWLVPLSLIVLLAVPWQQSVVGTGQVAAWAPSDRTQAIDAPIDGRLVEWHVVEGSRVRAGDLLVTLTDNDPLRLSRLETQRDAARAALEAAELASASLEATLRAEEARRALVLAEADARIAEQERRRVAEAAEVDTARLQDARTATLRDERLSSDREVELAALALTKALAVVEARDLAIAAARAAREEAAAEATAKIEEARSKVREAEGKVASARGALVEAESRLARQGTQHVAAPRDGTVTRLFGGPGGGQVKAGDALVELVPLTGSRAVELTLDGRDVALVRRGDTVRLLFEGWPALQFVGLPGTSTGTFGGVVARVDATDDGTGAFRVVVIPDPSGPPWPAAGVLRQGVRAKGFVLLRRVPLGVELWRQAHGFPPMPDVRKGDPVTPPASKKPRVPGALK